jgi:hypothetical protein
MKRKKSLRSSTKPQQETHFDGSALKEDLLTLGIDVDANFIDRMHRLGLTHTLSTTSQAATSLRNRNPYGMPSTIVYQNFDPTESIQQEKREIEQEWKGVDASRIYEILRVIHNPFHTNNRNSIAVQNLIQIFKIQYARSSDKFVEAMLATKNEKVIRLGIILIINCNLGIDPSRSSHVQSICKPS